MKTGGENFLKKCKQRSGSVTNTFQAVVPVLDAVARKYIPVQIVLNDIQLNFEETARTAATFLSVAQEKINTPIAALEVRESKTRGIYIKYLAEKPNSRNVRIKTFEDVWAEILNTTYHFDFTISYASENMFGGGGAN